MKVLKRIGIAILSLLAIFLIVFGVYFAYMQMHYYRIPDHKSLQVKNNPKQVLQVGKQYSAITYNVGFGAYNQKFDFFMDAGELKNGKKTHGTHGTAFSKKAVLASTDGVIKTMRRQNADFMKFQEIDTHSTRSYYVNQVRMMKDAFKQDGSVFADNFHSAYLFYPIYDPHGSVQSGLLTLSKYHIDSSVRRKYPVTSNLITKFTDLDRCFIVMKIPTSHGKQLILINTHMSAYDKGGKMRKAQMKLLSSVIEKEYNRGNYVIVGGDFNHALGRDMLHHFDHQEKVPSWVSVLDQNMLPKGFKMVKAKNREKVATVRSTDMPYRPKVNYQTVGDGFIVSKNVKASAVNINTDYRYADHNPVKLEFSLKR